MLELEYLERMERELLEEQLTDEWEECVILYPWEEYDFAA
jgi:hypothetical protein